MAFSLSSPATSQIQQTQYPRRGRGCPLPRTPGWGLWGGPTRPGNLGCRSVPASSHPGVERRVKVVVKKDQRFWASNVSQDRTVKPTVHNTMVALVLRCVMLYFQHLLMLD